MCIASEFVDSSSSWHNAHGLWAVDTINPNSANRIIKYLCISSADIALAQEAKLLKPAAASATEKQARA